MRGGADGRRAGLGGVEKRSVARRGLSAALRAFRTSLRVVWAGGWWRGLGSRTPLNGWCEPRPPAVSGETRLNHQHHRERDPAPKSARVGIGSKQDWAANTDYTALHFETSSLLPKLFQFREEAANSYLLECCATVCQIHKTHYAADAPRRS